MQGIIFYFFLCVLLLLDVVLNYLFKNLVLVLVIVSFHQVHQLHSFVDVTLKHLHADVPGLWRDRYLLRELDLRSFNPLY